MAILGPLLMAGGSLIGGLLGSSNARKAARSEEALGREALALQERIDTRNRADLAPWLQAGGSAIGQALSMTQPGYDHTTSPGYDFRVSEGQRGIEGSAAARGILQSGGTLKGIERFRQGMAADDYDRQFNRLASIAAGGQQTGATLGQLGSNMANNGSNILQGIGQARASGYAGQNQAIQGTLGNLFSIFGGKGGF